MLKIWFAILIKFESVNKMLQRSDLNISVAVQSYQSLLSHCLRTEFDDFFDEARSIYLELDAEEHTLKSRSAITLDNMEEKRDHCHTKMFIPVIASLTTNLTTRMQSYIQIDEQFGFITKLNELNAEQRSL